MSWCDYLCPGNPTNDPHEGVKEFNAWQLRVANGDATELTLDVRLARTVAWCREHVRHVGAVAIAHYIVRRYKDGAPLALDVHSEDLDEEARRYVLDVQFAEHEIPSLPASVIMELQNIARGEK